MQEALAAGGEEAANFNEEARATGEELSKNEEAFNEATDAIQEHADAVEEAGNAHGDLQENVAATGDALEETKNKTDGLTQSTQDLTAETNKANESVAQVQQTISDTVPVVQSLAEQTQEIAPAIKQVGEEALNATPPVENLNKTLEASPGVDDGNVSYPDVSAAINELNQNTIPATENIANLKQVLTESAAPIPEIVDNMSAFREIMASPDAYQAMIDHLTATGQTYESFAEDIGATNEKAFGNLLHAQDFIGGGTTPEELQNYLKSTGQSFGEFYQSIGEGNASAVENIGAFNDIIANPQPYNALAAYLKESEQSFSDFNTSIGAENAEVLKNSLAGDPAYQQAIQAQKDFIQQAKESMVAGAAAFYPEEEVQQAAQPEEPSRASSSVTPEMVRESLNDAALQANWAPMQDRFTQSDEAYANLKDNLRALSDIVSSSDPLTTLQEHLNATGQSWQQFAQTVGKNSVQDIADAIDARPPAQAFADNMAAFQSALENSDPLGVIESHIQATGQTYAQFTDDIGASNEHILENVQAFQDALKTSNPYESLTEYQKATGQSAEEFASTLSDSQAQTLDNYQAFNMAMQDPSPYEAIQAHLTATGQTQEEFAQSIGHSNALALDNMQVFQDNVQNGLNMTGFQDYLKQTGQDSQTFFGSIGKSFEEMSGSSGTSTIAQQIGAIGEEADGAEKSVGGFGGVLKGIFGEGGVLGDIGSGVGGAVSGIGDTFGNIMMGFDQFMRPLMYAQMAGQMIGSASSWLYNTNLQMEGPGASNPYSFTSQVNQLGLGAQQGANQFATGFGAGLNPSLNAWNNENNQTQGNDFWSSLGRISGGVVGGGADILETIGGSLLAGLSFENVGMMKTGIEWENSGMQGLVNMYDAANGLPLQYPGKPNPKNIYTGQDAEAAWLQSSYGGSFGGTSWQTTGPTDAMGAYEHAIAMRTGGNLTYPVPAPTPEVGADWSYFQSMPSYPVSNAPITGPLPQSQPGGFSNIFDPQAWQQTFGAIGDTFGTIQKDLSSNNVGGAGGAFNNLFGIKATPEQNAVFGQQLGQLGNAWNDLTSGNFGGAFGSFMQFLGPHTADQSGVAAYGGGSSGSFAGGCFVAGTPVRMTDGTEKAIEQLQVDDSILGCDGKQQFSATVLACMTFQNKQTYELYFSNGKILTLTDSHPLATPDGWKALSVEQAKIETPSLEVFPLKVKDLVYTVDSVQSLLSIKKKQVTQVYNITVDGAHTYYANDFLVHNIKEGMTAGSMTLGGTGTEAVQLTHTFTANVTWQANNLEKQFTAAVQWAASGLTRQFMASAEWTAENLVKAVVVAANWTEQNLIKPVIAAAQWTEQGLIHAATALANWTDVGLQHMATALAQWTDEGTMHEIEAVATWAEEGTQYAAKAIATWKEEGTAQMFAATASWVGENLEHTFTATASWIMGGIPGFASGVSDYSGGLAVVGEGGAPEVIGHNGQYSLVNEPTFVNLPPGSSVYPMQEIASAASSPRLLAGGTGDTLTPITLPMMGGNSGAQTADIHLYLDSYAMIQALGVPLAQSVRLGMGSRVF